MKRPIGVTPAHWADDAITAWAKGKHVNIVFAQVGQAVATVELREVTIPSLAAQFEEASTIEEKVHLLGRKIFNIENSGIQIIRGDALPEEPDVDLFFCRAEDCSSGPSNGADFFSSESARAAHEAEHVKRDAKKAVAA